MAFDFPNAPAVGTLFQPPGGPAYSWDGQKWAMSGSPMVWSASNVSRNLLINSCLQFSQQNGFGTGLTGSGMFTADQWATYWSGPAGATNIGHVAYSPDAIQPVGYITVYSGGTAFTPTGNHWAIMYQYIEGHNMGHLAWGRPSAIPAVATFEINADSAGTYTFWMNSNNADRTIVFPIVIAAGEVTTWKRFSIPIPAPTSGTFPRNNTIGAAFGFCVMAGSNYVTPNTGVWQAVNVFGMTGMSNLLATTGKGFSVRRMGLYADPTGSGQAPVWEPPEITAEMDAVKRYYQTHTYPAGGHWLHPIDPGAGYRRGYHPFTPQMRAAPTVSITAAQAGTFTGGMPTVTSITSFSCEPQGDLTTVAGYCYLLTLTANARM